MRNSKVRANVLGVQTHAAARTVRSTFFPVRHYSYFR